MTLEKIEKQEKELNEVEKTSMFNQLVMGKDVTETIQTSRGEFKIKYPRVADLQNIARLQAYRLNNIPAECFDTNARLVMLQVATLDIIVLSGPAWFENAKKENINFSWGSIPLQTFIQEVYAKAYEFRLKVQQLLESDTKRTNTEMDAMGNSANDDSAGLFDGISSEKL